LKGFAVDDDRACLQCGGPLQNRRSDTLFDSQRCKRRYYRRRQSSNYTDPTAWLFPDGADDRFREQLTAEGVRSQPLTDHERSLLEKQRRNPGVLLPELQQRLIDHERERQRREAESYQEHQPLKVETPLDPSSHGSLARRARYDRSRNRPQDPHAAILRPGPGRSGPHPWDDEPECITWPVGRNVIPWRT
jgi:hypothetical protein